MVTYLSLPISITAADTPPTLSLSTGGGFHGAVSRPAWKNSFRRVIGGL